MQALFVEGTQLRQREGGSMLFLAVPFPALSWKVGIIRTVAVNYTHFLCARLCAKPLTCLISCLLPKRLCNIRCYLHFAEKETEAHRGQVRNPAKATLRQSKD